MRLSLPYPQNFVYFSFLLFRFSTICLWAWWSHLRRDLPRHPSARVFGSARSDNALLALSLLLWLCKVLDCFVVGVENFLFGSDGLERPYLCLYYDDSRLEALFKCSLQFWMTFVRISGGNKGHLDALCDCTKHTPQYGTLSTSSADSVSTIVGEELVSAMTQRHLKQRILFLFSCMIVKLTCRLTTPQCQSSLDDYLLHYYSTCVRYFCTQLVAPWPCRSFHFCLQYGVMRQLLPQYSLLATPVCSYTVRNGLQQSFEED